MAEKRQYSEKTILAHKNLQNTFSDLDVEGVTILTGNNGSGKSVIRKQLPFAFKDLYNLNDVKETSGWVLSTSMDARTGSNAEWGALSGIMNDTSWVATSQNTLHSIKGLLDSAEKSEKVKYVVIDEYEIGCSEETIVALAQYISQRIQKLLTDKKIIGAMIITHSRIGCEHIQFDHFVNIEGRTYEEWKNREIIPTDLEELDANELFYYIRDNKE